MAAAIDKEAAAVAAIAFFRDQRHLLNVAMSMWNLP